MTADTTDLRPALEAELRRLRATPVGRRLAAIEVLLDDGSTSALPALEDSVVHRMQEAHRRAKGVSDAKLALVGEYMQKHGEARQVDIGRELKQNSGTISVALKVLADQGVVEDTGQVDDKAKVWRYTGPEPAPEPDEGNGNRTVKIEPGVGVSEGRRR